MVAQPKSRLNISIRSQLWIALLFLMVGLIQVSLAFYIATEYSKIGGKTYLNIIKLTTMNTDLALLEAHQNSVRASLLTLMVEKKNEQMNLLRDKVRRDHGDILVIYKNIIGNLKNPAILRLIRSSRMSYLEFSEIRDNHLIPLIFSNKRASAHLLSNRSQLTLHQSLVAKTKLAGQQMHQRIIELENESITLSNRYQLGVGISSIILLILFLWNQMTLRRSISHSLTQLTEGANRIGRGNFEHKISTGKNDEFAYLGLKMNEMAENLAENMTSLKALRMSNENYNTVQTQITKANQKLAVFTDMVCHDGRAPLRSIKTFLNFIYEDIESLLNEDQKHDFERVRKATHRLDNFFVDLNHFSKAGEHISEITAVDTNKILAEVLEDLNSMIIEHEGTINTEKLPRVNGSTTELRTIFQNLIANSIKYRRPEAQPVINVSHRMVDNQWIEIIFTENGEGFDSKFSEIIFEPFRRVTTQPAITGTGLGLATVAKLASYLGGSITAEGRPGKGSVFMLRLQKTSELSVKT